MDYSNWDDLNRLYDVFMDTNQPPSAVIDPAILNLSDEDTRAFFEPAWPPREGGDGDVFMPEGQGWYFPELEQISQITQPACEEQVEQFAENQQPQEAQQEAHSPWTIQPTQQAPQPAHQHETMPSTLFVQKPVSSQQQPGPFQQQGQQSLPLQQQVFSQQTAHGLTAPPTDRPYFQTEVLTALFSAEQNMLALVEKVRATRARVEFSQSVGRNTIKEMSPEKAEKLTEYLKQRARVIVKAAKGLEERVQWVVEEANR